MALAALVLAACAKNIDNREAVQAGIIRDVAKRGVNVEQMDVNVTSVSFRGNEADAMVSFVPKGGAPNSGVSMKYTLERVKDEWAIKGRAGSGHGMNGSELPGQQPLPTGVPGARTPSAPDGHLMPSTPTNRPLDQDYGSKTNANQSHGGPGSRDQTDKLPAGHPPVQSGANPGNKQ